MPEACFMCLDSTPFMRNGDFFPTRMMATQEAANLLVGAKMGMNPENTIGFLTMGGKSCNVMETLTKDMDRVMASVTKINVDGTLHFAHGLQIASLALSHRLNPRAEKRVVAFVGSQIQEDEKQLEKLAKKLRKDEVAVDIVAFGCEENLPVLEKFIGTVNKANNSHLLVIPNGSQITDTVLSSVIVYGEDAAVAAAGATGGAGGAPSAGGAPGGGFEFGVDPNADPELAMVLRMSMEEERRRLEGVAAANGEAPKAADVEGGAPTTSTTNDDAQPSGDNQNDENRVLTEDEELELALKMSMMPEEEDEASKPADVEGESVDPAFDEALQDPEFMKELEDLEKKAGEEEKKDEE